MTTVTTRRSRHEGSVFYDTGCKCWVGQIDLGIDPDTGKRRRPKVSGRDKSDVLEKLDTLRSEKRTTGTVAPRNVTVEMTVRDWLADLPPRIKSPVSVRLAR